MPMDFIITTSCNIVKILHLRKRRGFCCLNDAIYTLSTFNSNGSETVLVHVPRNAQDDK